MPNHLRRILVSGVLLALAMAVHAEEQQPRLELIDVEKVWDRAPHNAFTGLIRFQNKWYLTFREAPYHGVPKVGETPGKARVLRSNDGKHWESAALLDYGPAQDVRDPKLSITHDGLLWVSYYSSHEGKTSIYLARVKVYPPPGGAE